MKRTVRWILAGSAVASAVCGIQAFQAHRWSPRFLHSALLAFLASAFLLLFADVREKRRAGWFPLAGAVSTFVFLGLALAFVSDLLT